jgi:7-carboxy-7-deazaguanine synthase
VEVTGGEPLLQPSVHALMERLCDAGYQVLLETGGGLDISPVDPRVHRIIDVKCPGSGEAEHNHWPNLERLRPGDQVKFVLGSRSDYEWARGLVRERALDATCSVLFSPVHDALDLEPLASWVLEDRLGVRVQVQLHKLIWGAETRGV